MRSTKDFFIPVLFALLLALASSASHAQTFTVLHTFHGAPSDGDEPMATLLRDTAGNLYGTTGVGGSGGNCTPLPGCGTVFMLNKSGQELGVFSFNGQDGTSPIGGVFRDPAGNLYGTTAEGGGSQGCSGCGTIFQLNKTGSKIRYYSFDGTDGRAPESTPVVVSGSLFGTTNYGGSGGFGTIFKINARGKETVVHSFNATDGCYPHSGLTVDKKGNLYGVTFEGGLDGSCSDGSGTAYELDTAGNFTVLARLDANAFSSLILDSEGNLYGTTEYGGNGEYCTGGCGTVFKLSSNNGTWSVRTLYAFCPLRGCADGESPVGSVVRDAAGNIYGTTYFGGAFSCGGLGCGTIFKIDPFGNETVLHNFTGGSDGSNPFGGLIIDAAGNLYGTAELGGDTSCDTFYGGCGVVFELTP